MDLLLTDSVICIYHIGKKSVYRFWVVLKSVYTCIKPCIFNNFLKGDNFCDGFCFSIRQNAFKQKFCSCGKTLLLEANSFLYELQVTPIEEGCKNENGKSCSPEHLPMHLNCLSSNRIVNRVAVETALIN